MAKKSKIVIKIFAVILALFVALFVAAALFVQFYLIPKYNSNISPEAGEEQKLTSRDIFNMAKYLTDKQVLENIQNFDKSAAKDLLGTLVEIEKEIGEDEESPEITKAVESVKNVPKNELIKETIPDIIKESGVAVDKQQQSAYDRIMAAATKEEIAAGMAIISKVDLAKVNALHSAGKRKEMKAYIKKVLSASEIKKSLSLYKKYKHLL